MKDYLCARCGKEDHIDESARFPICSFCNHDNLIEVDLEESNRIYHNVKILHPELSGWEQYRMTNDILRDIYIFDLPDFDKVLYNKMLTDEEEKNREVERWIEETKSASSGHPKCPTCGSLNTYKISGMSKAVSVGLFGLFSQKVKHQFHCNNCGYEW